VLFAFVALGLVFLSVLSRDWLGRNVCFVSSRTSNLNSVSDVFVCFSTLAVV